MPDFTPEQQAQVSAAMEAGIEAANTTPAAVSDDGAYAAPAAPTESAPPEAGTNREDWIDPAVTPPESLNVDGTPKGDEPPAPDPAAAKPADAGATPAEGEPKAAADAQPDSREATDAEDDKLAASLKGRTKERFEALSGEVRQYREALDKAGIKDVAELAQIQERAARAEDFTAMVMDTGADGQQFSQALDYLTLVNQATRSGNAASAKKALDMLVPAVQALTAISGMDIEVLFGQAADPLAAHEDLAKAVDQGDMTRKAALEVVAARTQLASRQQAEQQAAEAQQSQQAQQQGIQWLQQFDAQMAADPTYAGKRPILHALVTNIRQTLPPAQWPDAVRRAYASIPAQAPAAPPAAPAGTVPNAPRVKMGTVAQPGSGGTGASMVQQFTDPMQALEAGLAAAGNR